MNNFESIINNFESITIIILCLILPLLLIILGGVVWALIYGPIERKKIKREQYAQWLKNNNLTESDNALEQFEHFQEEQNKYNIKMPKSYSILKFTAYTNVIIGFPLIFVGYDKWLAIGLLLFVILGIWKAAERSAQYLQIIAKKLDAIKYLPPDTTAPAMPPETHS